MHKYNTFRNNNINKQRRSQTPSVRDVRVVKERNDRRVKMITKSNPTLRRTKENKYNENKNERNFIDLTQDSNEKNRRSRNVLDMTKNLDTPEQGDRRSILEKGTRSEKELRKNESVLSDKTLEKGDRRSILEKGTRSEKELRKNESVLSDKTLEKGGDDERIFVFTPNKTRKTKRIEISDDDEKEISSQAKKKEWENCSDDNNNHNDTYDEQNDEQEYINNSRRQNFFSEGDEQRFESNQNTPKYGRTPYWNTEKLYEQWESPTPREGQFIKKIVRRRELFSSEDRRSPTRNQTPQENNGPTYFVPKGNKHDEETKRNLEKQLEKKLEKEIMSNKKTSRRNIGMMKSLYDQFQEMNKNMSTDGNDSEDSKSNETNEDNDFYNSKKDLSSHLLNDDKKNKIQNVTVDPRRIQNILRSLPMAILNLFKSSKKL